MRRFLIISIFILFVCSTLSIAKDNDKIAEKLYWSIEDYYSAYLEFPQSVESLCDFLWFYINDNHNFVYDSIDDYVRSNNNLTAGNDAVLLFLMENKKNIHIHTNGDKFELFYKKKKIELVKNVCDEVRDPVESGLLFRMRSNTYGIDGKLTRGQYEDELFEGINRLKRSLKASADSIYFNDQLIMRYVLLRFERNKGLSSVCPDSLDFQAPFLLQLDSCLNDFVKDKDEIEKIVFVTKMVK